MAENFYEKKYTLRDLREILLLPLLVGGGGLGFYGSNILAEKLNNEIERRKVIEQKLDAATDKIYTLEKSIILLQQGGRRYAP